MVNKHALFTNDFHFNQKKYNKLYTFFSRAKTDCLFFRNQYWLAARALGKQ